MDRRIVDEEVFESKSTTDNSTINNIATTHIEVNFEDIYSTSAIDTTTTATATTFVLNNYYYISKISTVNHDLNHCSCSSRTGDHILSCHF